MSARSLEDFARRKLAALGRRHLRRSLPVTEFQDATRVLVDGKALVAFAGNDYLGLAHDPATTQASVAATRRYGTGAGAARLVCDNHTPYARLERRLAELKGTEAAVVFGSGYLANLGAIPVLAGRADLILIDALAHSCLLAGARLSGATVMPFAHNAVEAVDALLTDRRHSFRHCLLVTEGVFSMDGDLAPLPALARLAARHGAWLLTDDAHGLGVVGNGRGSSFAHGVDVDVPLQMGTLSKAVGAYGGYLCASEAVVDLLRNRAASFVYSTGLPPGVVAAASTALDVIVDDDARVARPLAHARRFTDALGLKSAESAIVPIVIGPVDGALAASADLSEHGFFVPAIRPPTVPAGTARLRFTFSAAHSDGDVDSLIAAVRALGLGR